MKHTIQIVEQALIPTTLDERAKWKQRGVALASPEQQIEALIGQDLHYISFTSIEKLGINPSTKYATPVGVYAYPTADPWFEIAWRATMNNTAGAIPFAVHQPYVQLFRARSGSGMVVVNEEGRAVQGRQIIDRALRELERTRSGEDMAWVREQMREKGYDLRSDMSMLWLTTMLLSHRDRYADRRVANSLRPDNQHVALWTKMMLDLGIAGFEDRGSGTIHPNEPHQAVIFRMRDVELINTVINPTPAAREARDYIKQSAPKLKTMRKLFASFTERYSSFIKRHGLEGKNKVLGGFLGSVGDNTLYSFDEFVELHSQANIISVPDLDLALRSLEGVSSTFERFVIDYERSSFVRTVLVNDASALSASKVLGGAEPSFLLRTGAAVVQGADITNRAEWGRTMSGWTFMTRLNAVTLDRCELDLRTIPINKTIGSDQGSARARLYLKFAGGSLIVPPDLLDGVRLPPLLSSSGGLDSDALAQRAEFALELFDVVTQGSYRFRIDGSFALEDELEDETIRALARQGQITVIKAV